MSSQEWEGAYVRHAHLGVEVTKPGSQYTMILKPKEFEAKIAADAAPHMSQTPDDFEARAIVAELRLFNHHRAADFIESTQRTLTLL